MRDRYYKRESLEPPANFSLLVPDPVEFADGDWSGFLRVMMEALERDLQREINVWEFSAWCGVNPWTVSNILNNAEAAMRPRTMERLGEHLGVPIAEMDRLSRNQEKLEAIHRKCGTALKARYAGDPELRRQHAEDCWGTVRERDDRLEEFQKKMRKTRGKHPGIGKRRHAARVESGEWDVAVAKMRIKRHKQRKFTDPEELRALLELIRPLKEAGHSPKYISDELKARGFVFGRKKRKDDKEKEVAGYHVVRRVMYEQGWWKNPNPPSRNSTDQAFTAARTMIYPRQIEALDEGRPEGSKAQKIRAKSKCQSAYDALIDEGKRPEEIKANTLVNRTWELYSRGVHHATAKAFLDTTR